LQAYAVQEAPDLILPAAIEDVPLDAADGHALGAAEPDLSHAAQQAATAASASPEVSAMHKQQSSSFQHFINSLHACADVLVSFNH